MILNIGLGIVATGEINMSKLRNTFTLDTVMDETLPLKYSMKFQDAWYYCFWRAD